MLIPASLFLLLAVNFSEGVSTECGKGRYRSGGKCQLCPPGTYQNATNATSCHPCPKGHYFPYQGGQAIIVCKACSENTFLDKVGATSKRDCKPCPNGTNSPEGSFGCHSCPTGQVVSLCRQVLDRSDCFGITIPRFGVCVTNNFCSFDTTFTPQRLICAPCTRSTCSCKGGFFTKEGFCRKCPAGTYSTSQDCKPCKNYQISKRASSDCENCPAESQGNKRSGATRCVMCPPNKFKGSKGSACKKSTDNENSFTVGATSRQRNETPCANNFFRARSGSCEQCTRVERYDPRMNKCVPCRPNESSLGGVSTNCARCPRGAVGSSEGCVCAAGWELDINGKCQPCKPGTAKRSTATAFCEPCEGATFLEDRGSVAPKPGMEKCTACPPRTRQDLDSQTKCKRLNCGKNLVFNEEKSACIDPATKCPPDYEALQGADFRLVCNPKTCPPRTERRYNPDFNVLIVSCDSCGEGFVYDDKQDQCKFCGDDSVSDGVSDTRCTKCPEGYSASPRSNCICGSGRQVVNGKCVKCPKGSFRGEISADKCLPCPAGTIVSNDGEKCNPCRAGQFSASASTKCKPCPTGTTTFGRGEANCVSQRFR